MTEKSPSARGSKAPAKKESEQGSGTPKGITKRELISEEPPPLETTSAEPIRREGKLGRLQLRRQQGWIAVGMFALLTITIGLDLVGAAVLSGEKWARFSGEMHDIRTWLFFIVGSIVGYFFGKSR